MKDKYILAVNPIPYEGKPAINLYWVGSFINEQFVPDDKMPKKLEVINRMLSPSVSLDKEGNTTAIAIIPDLIHPKLQLKHGWTHLYSIPRIWNLKNGEIYQTPHPALEKLRDSLRSFKNTIVNSSENLKLGFGHQIEIVAEISPLDSKKFGFYIGKNQNNKEETKIYFDLKKNQLVIDLSNSSKNELVEKRIEIGDLNLKASKTIKIQLFIDGSVVEGFINDKEAFTTRIFPEFFNSDEVEVFSGDSSILINKLDFWKLKGSTNLTDF
jgi:sucrose-6-phosphate hydrolase SacC (GH32 family)